MSSKSSMLVRTSLIGRMLESFCHVEWHEVDALAALVRRGSARFDVIELRRQFEALLAQPEGIAVAINALTLREFETDEQARSWLQRVYRQVFF